MAANNRTLKELAAPTLEQQPLCIKYPSIEVAFELKFGMIHLLPTFSGFAREDPNKHLKEFYIVCLSMKPTGVFEEQVELRVFPFSLANTTKKWLYYLPPHGMRRINSLLKSTSLHLKATNFRKEIHGIR